MVTVPVVFNRKIIKSHRQRAALLKGDYDYLLSEVSSRITERLNDLSLSSCRNILNIGSNKGQLTDVLHKLPFVDMLVNQDISENIVRRVSGLSLVADEEKMPFKGQSFDIVTSCLMLHLVNDLPGVLMQVKHILKNNGVFIASLYGVGTLVELKDILLDIETNYSKGVSPRISPFIEIKSFGQLVQNIGFFQPVIDVEEIKVSYKDIYHLMHDIRGMGETCALIKTRQPLNKNLLKKADCRYKEKFSDSEGGIIATFNIITITALAAKTI